VWPVSAGALCGAAVGAVAFGATRLSEPAMFTGAGAILGACAPFLSKRLRGWVRVSELTVRIPQFSDLTFVVDDDARLVAWRLYVEVSTRISTQPLASDEGLLREALNSLYSLFATTRRMLKASRPTAREAKGEQSVEHFAITMLNSELRPFLSKWHPRLERFEAANPGSPETEWEFNDQCRAELARVSANTLQYAFAFARLAGVRNPEAVLGDRPGPASAVPRQSGAASTSTAATDTNRETSGEG
jgi:hypothetical protein